MSLYGLNLNTVFMPIVPVSEDGTVVSDGLLDNLKFIIYDHKLMPVKASLEIQNELDKSLKEDSNG